MSQPKLSNSHYAYYGEYSIDSWIEFVLNEEVKLPAYQRTFVWNLKQATNLVEAILDDKFVPPLTIASIQYKLGDIEPGIYLVDGQQRLSSILLFYLGVWPNKNPDSVNIDDDDDAIESIEWTFSKLQKLYEECNSIENLHTSIEKTGEYVTFENVDLKFESDELKKDVRSKAIQTFERLQIHKKEFLLKTLGYSFVKSIGDFKDEKLLFANLFREINTSGKSLTKDESRQAMYYIEPDLKKLFRPDFLTGYTTTNNKALDFSRYLSYAYDYSTRYPDVDRVARGFSNDPDGYILKFIDDTIELYANTNGCQFLSNLKNFEHDFRKLFTKKDTAAWEIGNAEVYLFGLIYWVLIKGKRIDLSKKDKLKNNLTKDKLIIGQHERVGAIRKRLKHSVKTYEKYLAKEDARNG
ncbi:MAG: DUF262 domain-containing protein [Oscillospiraceae bacterium]|jgi:hypothetical protein|nr:DUF262 domain-containing protein [Oscillospiraceae bacterium]